MFIDGLKLFAAYLIILIPTALIIFLIGVPLRFRTILNPYAMIMSMTPVYIASFIIGVLAGLYLFMAIPHMIYVGRVGAVFSFSEVLERIRKIGYGDYLAIYMVTFILAWLLALVGSLIPIIGVPLITSIAILLARVQGLVFKSTIS